MVFFLFCFFVSLLYLLTVLNENADHFKGRFGMANHISST